MNPQNTRRAVTLAAALLAASGAVLLFAPDAVGATGAERVPVAQLFGGALLGFAAMNWVARGAALGGIYGRAVVTGNYTHFVIGMFVLIGKSFAAGAKHPAFWAVTACYVAGAILFTRLQFFSSGLPKRS